jgi:hypothetical protein
MNRDFEKTLWFHIVSTIVIIVSLINIVVNNNASRILAMLSLAVMMGSLGVTEIKQNRKKAIICFVVMMLNLLVMMETIYIETVKHKW